MRPGFFVCICTYRRPTSLAGLLAEIREQSVPPEVVIVVDGDPASGDVERILSVEPSQPRLVLVASNHANLAYQRYLGYASVSRLGGGSVLLYLDDDLHLPAGNVLEKWTAPFDWPERYVTAVTAPILTPSSYRPDVAWGSVRHGWLSQLIRRWGSSGRTPPGEVTPTGHRTQPEGQRSYERVGWLSGGVMAFRLRDLTAQCFSDVVFAACERGWVMGEDLYLSRRVRLRGGEMILARCAPVEHPSIEASTCRPAHAEQLGFAIAHNRRLLADAYRGVDWPPRGDRRELALSYAANVILAWLRYLGSWREDRRGYALGYMRGAWRAVRVRPSAAAITPGIDWWADAESVLGSRASVEVADSQA